MTKTYELPNGKMLMADVDEKHHTATISAYALDDLVEAANKVDVLDKIRAEIDSIELSGRVDGHTKFVFVRTAEQVKNMALDVIDKYRAESEEE